MAFRNMTFERSLKMVGVPHPMFATKKVPTSLDDAIRAQAAAINQLADEHAELRNQMAVKGELLQRAHADLTNMLARRQAAG